MTTFDIENLSRENTLLFDFESLFTYLFDVCLHSDLIANGDILSRLDMNFLYSETNKEPIFPWKFLETSYMLF